MKVEILGWRQRVRAESICVTDKQRAAKAWCEEMPEEHMHKDVEAHTPLQPSSVTLTESLDDSFKIHSIDHRERSTFM